MADHILRFSCCDAVTFTASAAITGGQLVEVTGSRTVGPAGDGSAKVVGSAGNDADTGDQVVVHLSRCIDDLVAGAAVTAGAAVQADANGKVKPVGTGAAVGLALTAAASAGTTIQVLRA